MDFAVFDTEDNSPELQKKNRPGFEKKVSLVSAIGPHGKVFTFRPKVKRVLQHAEFKTYEMEMEPFYNWLQSFGHLRCYAHNLSYDLGNIFDRPDRYDCTLVGSRIINAKWRNVVFMDTFNIWPMSLKKIGEKVGIKKGDLDVHSKGYVERDCMITRKAVQVAEKFAASHEVDLPATLGSLSVRIWQAMGGENWHTGEDLYREAYFGGRVELFMDECTEPGYYTDINSLYPYVMTKEFPVADEPWLGFDSPRECADHICNLNRHAYGIARVVLDVPEQPICPLPVERDDGSIFYPWGIIDGVYTIHEIRNAMRHGAVLKEISECYGSLTGWPYYRDFMFHMYSLREHEKNEAQRQYLKLLINNLYGQLGMSGLVTRSLNLDKWIAKDENGMPLLDERGEPVITREGTHYGEKLLCEIQMPLPEHANYMHAAYVTSYARLELQKYLRLIPTENLIYCDTDSVFFKWPKDKKIPFPISTKLGGMKVEHKISYAKTSGPKMYRLKTEENGKTKNVWKAKGIPNKKPKGRGNFKSYPQVYHERGIVEYDAPYRLREHIAFFDAQETKGLNLNSRVASVWRKVRKEKRSQYDKKRLKGNHWQPIRNVFY